jgi:hypothetical protein
MTTKTPAHNSTYKKLAVQWLNEGLSFVSSSVLADSFVLRTPSGTTGSSRRSLLHNAS